MRRFEDLIEVIYEPHEEGGSIWVYISRPVSRWVCVWSTAEGNMGQFLEDTPAGIDVSSIPIPSAWLAD